MLSADFGVESPYYYSFTVRNGPFRYVVMTGDHYTDILDKYTQLTGRPALPPAFTFGFMGSSMDFTEPDDARDRVMEYLDNLKKYDIPCEGLYLADGYCKSDDGFRYAFEWNRKKFPDPAQLIQSVRSKDFHVAANIKPGIPESHPAYREYAEQQCLIPDSSGQPYLEDYPGGSASLWNFHSPGAFGQWKKLLKNRLTDYGIDGIWNDNNEFEIEDAAVPLHAQRSTQPLLMCQASYETLLEEHPGKRPWIVTRSGGIGIQRYARTWSGGNTSDWESLRFNTFMGLSMGLSGMPFIGHDIGGFFGGHPGNDLMLRWCQSAVFQPRFVIHSRNDDGVPTELWSYKSIWQQLRCLVLQHYEFMPYILSQAWQAHRKGTPLQRPLILEFPTELKLTGDEDAYMFGDAILVILSLEPRCNTVKINLPTKVKWYDPEYEVLLSGKPRFSADIKKNRTRYLIKTGSVVVRAPGTTSLRTGWFPKIHVDVYPDQRETSSVFTEDDGESLPDQNAWASYETKIIPEKKGRWTVSCTRSDTNEWTPLDEEREFEFNVPPGFEIYRKDHVSAHTAVKPPKHGETVYFTVIGSYTTSTA